MMRRSFLAHLTALAVLPIAPASSHAGEPPCDPARVGVADIETVAAFVAAVREAMGSPETGRLANVVHIPLRVSSRDRQYGQFRFFVIHSADDLGKHASAVFATRFRKKVLRAAPDDLICLGGRLGLANGALWASPIDGRLQITSVNNDDFQWPGMTSDALLTCRTSDHQIVIDRPRAHVRYRAWKSARSPGRPKPDLLIAEGVETVEGTGPCTHRVWVFRRGRYEYLVEPEEGCSADEPPPGRVGRLSVLKDGILVKEWDCMRTQKASRE